LQRYPGDDVAQKILHREADNDRCYSGGDQQSLNRLFIANLEDQENGHQKDQ
jgi:hypothetical protein